MSSMQAGPAETPSRNAIALFLLQTDTCREQNQPGLLDSRQIEELLAALRERSLTPADLLSGEPVPDSLPEALRGNIQTCLSEQDRWKDYQENLENSSLGMVSVFDSGYPALLRDRMGPGAPSLLFHSRNLEIARIPDGPNGKPSSIGVVGSRKIPDPDSGLPGLVGCRIAEAGMVLVSGNAPGTDRQSMNSALDAGGKVIAVLGGGLREEIRKDYNRTGLDNGNLLFLCPLSPETGFHGTNLLGRNKHIYALSGAVVIPTAGNRSGTSSGARQQLDPSSQNLQYCPVHVCWPAVGEPASGIQEIHRMGALKLNRNPDGSLPPVEAFRQLSGVPWKQGEPTKPTVWAQKAAGWSRNAVHTSGGFQAPSRKDPEFASIPNPEGLPIGHYRKMEDQNYALVTRDPVPQGTPFQILGVTRNGRVETKTATFLKIEDSSSWCVWPR